MTVAATMMVAAVLAAAAVAASPAPDLSTDVSRPATVETSTEQTPGKKFGDKCSEDGECRFVGGMCDKDKNMCQCLPDLEVTDHVEKCGKEKRINESCDFTEQCEHVNFQTECRDGRCTCRYELTPVLKQDGSVGCVASNTQADDSRYVDPAMIGVLVGMALMFIILCVVLRLFSKARWRENRTIFNTPNPRLMNVSLLRDSKLLHGDQRRGSRSSVRVPSRQPSMASLRPHSPTASQGSRRGSKTSSNASATSTRSPKSPTRHPAGNTAADNVTVEVREPKP